MKPVLKYSLSSIALVLGLVLLDQLTKLAIHAHFDLGEAQPLTDWFWICYVENNGIAFGIEWFSKLFLTLFRLIAVGLLGWYVFELIKKVDARPQKGKYLTYILMVLLVMAGALGNVIDCVFYGVAFDYAPLFYGKVIDWLYFPLIRNSAGEVIFFQPVFNLADSYITCAVLAIVLFFRKELNESLSKSPKA